MMAVGAIAAPYADFVMDARTGEVLRASNADTRLHPASLTKMMTLYIAFEAIERGEISLDTKVKISGKAAAEPPSRLGLKAGQTIQLRYLIRAAAVKSANDAATAIGEAIEGSEAAFARRMNRTAKALGMNSTTFKNANGLTESGHLSTARDMSVLGRRLFYDHPDYYHIFSRRTADAGKTAVSSTNRRFLDSYEGADGIKTGYTAAAGYNLVASAQRGNKRIIATVFGGKSSNSRNARIAELLDLGFGKAPNKAPVNLPKEPVYAAEDGDPVEGALAEALAENGGGNARAVAKTVRVLMAPTTSPRPQRRAPASPSPEPPPEEMLVAMTDGIAGALAEAEAPPSPVAEASDAELVALIDTALAAEPAAQPVVPTAPDPRIAAAVPRPRPAQDEANEAAVVADAGIRPIVSPELQAALAEVVSSAPARDEPQPTPMAEAPDPVMTAEAAPAPVPAPEVVPLQPQPMMIATAHFAPVERPRTGPKPRPENLMIAAALAEANEGLSPVETAAVMLEPEVVTRMSTSGGKHWGVNIGRYASRYEAEQQLLRVALSEIGTLDEALRKVSTRGGGYDANFMGLNEETAAMACRRLEARALECEIIGPAG
ncbi:MAG: serine hydrolase [Paracoccaceae bacterium]